MPDDYFRCSFCGKPQSQVKRLIGGANALICNECVERYHKTVHDGAPSVSPSASPVAPPARPEKP